MTDATPPVIFVAALTYRRLDMLSRLLELLLSLELPRDWSIRFLIVDNDPAASAEPIIAAVAHRYQGALRYVVEAAPGIPAARNRAIDEATHAGARLLCFVDDDELPEPTWLRELVSHHQATGSTLIGGPVRTLPPDYSMSPLQRFLARSLVARSAFMEAHIAKLARRGKIMMVATGNWMGDLLWIRSEGLRFDDRMVLSGGSDTAFFLATRSRGGKPSWCERAIVYEYLERKHLSLSYQFMRSMAQSIVLAKLQPEPIWWMCLRQSGRMVVGACLTVFPLFGFASFAIGVHMIAAAIGRFSSLSGAESKLYSRTPTQG